MNTNKIKLVILPIILILSIITFTLFYSKEVILQYECCNEIQYLNNYGVIMVNAVPFIAVSLLMAISILVIRINTKVLLSEIILITLFSCVGVMLMVFCYYADKDMVYQIDNAYYTMIEDVLYDCLISLVILSCSIRLIMIFIEHFKNRRIKVGYQ